MEAKVRNEGQEEESDISKAATPGFGNHRSDQTL
jgi:hypothetical protein